MRLKLKSGLPDTEPGILFTGFKSGEMRVRRPVVDVSKCKWCGTCYLFCPTGSLIDKGTHFEANLDYCKGCGICAHMCPVYAITMVREEY